MGRSAFFGRRREGFVLRIGLATLICAIACALALPSSGTASNKLALGICSRLLDNEEVLGVTGEQAIVAGVSPEVDKQEGSVFMCGWGADSNGGEAGSHTMILDWSPSFRNLRLSDLFFNFEASICYLSLKGCRYAKDAERERNNLEGFRSWALAFKEAGTIKFLNSGFGGNPALIWRMEHPPLENDVWALLYDEEIGSGLLVNCSARVPGATEDVPDTMCAKQALRRAYHNQATRLLPHPPHKH